MKLQISCYSCRKSGHFSTFCPEKSCGYNLNKKFKPSISSSFQSFPVTNCRCGGGLCKIKITPKTQKCFYTCPNINELHCGYFKLCEDLKAHEILHKSPPIFPICSCGAGVCRLEIVREGPDSGRRYFACRIKKLQGACNFWQWQDEKYNQPTSNVVKDTIAYDDSIANEIDMIRKEFEDGGMDLDFPLDEMEINSSSVTFSGDNMTHSSPVPSPVSPLDVAAFASTDSQSMVVKWFPCN